MCRDLTRHRFGTTMCRELTRHRFGTTMCRDLTRHRFGTTMCPVVLLLMGLTKSALGLSTAVLWTPSSGLAGHTFGVCGRLREVSRVDCAVQGIAIGCHVTAYRPPSGDIQDNCILLRPVVKPSPSEQLWTGDGDWSLHQRSGETLRLLVFRVSAGSGANTHGTFTSETLSSASSIGPALDMTTPLSQPFKSPLFEAWGNLNVKTVTVEMWKNGRTVVDMAFNATGRTDMEWFKSSTLVSSNWSDLQQGTSASYQIRGNEERSFKVQGTGGNCQDWGWIVVVDGTDFCSWGRFSAYPRFIYSTGSNKQFFGDGARGLADDFVLYIDVEL